MKLNLGRRLVLFMHWLASLIVLAMLVIPGYAGIALSYVTDLIPASYMHYVVIALISVYLLLSLGVLCIIFKRSQAKRSERGFITVDSADSGKVRISIHVIEQMVKQAAYNVDGVADMKISITNAEDAIAIGLNVTMISGSHVPTVTLNLQRAIHQYVEMNSGVAVRSVSVSIQSVTTPGENGKKSKYRDAKTAQEPNSEPALTPVAVPTVEIEPDPEPVVEQTPAENNSDASVEEYSLAVPAEEQIETVVEELNTEEENKN